MKVHRVLTYLVAAGVAFQAATIALTFFGLTKWVENGGDVNQATAQGDGAGVGGVAALNAHGYGGMVIGLLALVFLVVSFVAKVPGGVPWAAVTFALVVLQIFLGIFSHAVTPLGGLHGVDAVAIAVVALLAGMRVSRAIGSRATAPVRGAGAPV